MKVDGPFVPRRVLMTADAVGGVFPYALELSRGLSEMGVEVVLATLGPEPDERQRRRAEAVPGLRLVTCPWKLEWMDDPWDDVAEAGGWLLRLERDVSPDIIHLNGYTQGNVSFHAPALLVAHSCVLSWWKAVRGAEAPAAWNRYRDLVSAALSAAQVVAAPTRAMLRELEAHYGPLPHGTVVPNGREPSLFSPGPKEPLVAASGRLWDEAKDFALLDRVAPHLTWAVAAAGPAAGPGGQRFVATQRGLTPLGSLDEPALAALLARASIFVSCARYEPFGLSPLEAALAGCALVLSDIPSLREVWGEAALFAPPKDERAFAATIQALIETPLLRAHQARRARLRALQFSPAAMVLATLRAYEEAVRRYPAPGRAAHEALHAAAS